MAKKWDEQERADDAAWEDEHGIHPDRRPHTEPLPAEREHVFVQRRPRQAELSRWVEVPPYVDIDLDALVFVRDFNERWLTR